MNAQQVYDFSAESKAGDWFVVDDGVMGGRSQGQVGLSEEGHGIFQGTVSLENNGGFASVRAVLGRRDLSACSGLDVGDKAPPLVIEKWIRGDPVDPTKADGELPAREFAGVVGEVMTYSPVTIRYDAPLEEAAQLAHSPAGGALFQGHYIGIEARIAASPASAGSRATRDPTRRLQALASGPYIRLMASKIRLCWMEYINKTIKRANNV